MAICRERGEVFLNHDSIREELERKIKALDRDMDARKARMGRKAYMATDHHRVNKRQRDAYERRLVEIECTMFGAL